MSKEKFTHGFGYVKIGDNKESSATNFNPDERLQELLFRNLVRGTYSWRGSIRPTSSVMFLRPGKLRYTKPNTLLVAASPESAHFLNRANSRPGGTSYYTWDQYYNPISSYDFRNSNNSSQFGRYSYDSAEYTTTEWPHTFASVSFALVDALTGVSGAPEFGPGMPTNQAGGWTAVSYIDIPGTSIGTLWKHPPDRTAWFNETGIVALSQGNVEISGPYSPSESLMQHSGYQVYYTKSGGSGRPGSPTNSLLTSPAGGTNGNLSATDTFFDAALQNKFLSSYASGASPASILVSGTATSASSRGLTDSTKSWTVDGFRDKLVKIVSGAGAGQARLIASNSASSLTVSVQWATSPDSSSVYQIVEPSLYYLRINSGASKGTYLIVDFIDSNTVKVDAPAVNTPLVTETGVSWEIVTGPVGEYFFRKRFYYTGTSWGNNTDYENSNFLALGDLWHEVFSLQNTRGTVSVNAVHDRGACWWSVANNGSVQLMRWVHMSPQAFEPMHVPGKITGLNSWPFLETRIRDIAIDDQDHIWVVGDPLSSTGLGGVRNGRINTLRIDPHPGGDALMPELDGYFSGDVSSTATLANPIGANDVRAVVSEDSKKHAPNSRVFLIPGTSDPLNAVSYTTNYGTDWKRLHPLHSRTGTASVSGTTVTGTGTAFDTEFAPGDWIRFGDGTSLLLNLNGSDGARSFQDRSDLPNIVYKNGDARISTVQSKFGGSSLALNGTDAFLSTPWSSGFTFGTGDFTVECWVYLTATPNGESIITDSFTGTGDEIGWAFHFTTTSLGATTGSNIAFGSYNGSSWTGVTSTSTPALNTWVHLAACRQSGTLRLFMDGVQIASGAFGTNIPVGETLRIGRRWDSTGTRNFMSGFMDSIRVIKGRAAYVSPFSPPAAAFAENRSYEIQAVSGSNEITLATAYAGIISDASIYRGVFPDANSAATALWNTGNGDAGSIGPMRSPADWDTEGNVLWLSADANLVTRWNHASGNADILPANNAAHTISIESGGCCSLAVQRIPNPNNQEKHRLADSIWIGSRYQGMIRLESSFDGSGTRYHRNYANAWPITGNMPQGTEGDLYTNRLVLNPMTGAGTIYGKYRYLAGNDNYHYGVGMHGSETGLLQDYGAPWDYDKYYNYYIMDAWGQYGAMLTANCDDIGLGVRAAMIPTSVGGNATSGGVFCERWLCKRWDGTQWKFGHVNESSASIDFSGLILANSPRTGMPVNAGTGVKRMHPDWQLLDADTGLKIRFTDTNIQSVAQSQQFLVDETTTFVCYVGNGKDTNQTARWGVDGFTHPTYTRFQEESNKLAKNIWTQDGGIEGGFSFDSAPRVNAYNPPFARGLSIPSRTVPHGGAPYPNLSGTLINTGPYQHYSAVLRIKPEFERSADGSIFGATPGSETRFKSASHLFSAADIGKSIVIEGANGNTADAANGQAVIMSIDPLDGYTAITDKTFSTNRSNLRWKLMDIPAASYAVMNLEHAYAAFVLTRMQFSLYSSSDRGVTWQLRKFVDSIRNKAANSDIRLHQDADVFFNTGTWFKSSYGSQYYETVNCPIFFDLRSLPENLRRRQYWKIIAFDVVRDSGVACRSHGISLLDENMKYIGIPDNCILDDALDSEFRNSLVYSAAVVAFSGTGMSPVDVGTGTGLTDTLSFGGTFYLQSGTNNAEIYDGYFSSPAAIFSPQDVGKSLRISGSIMPGNNGMATVTAYIDANTVITDKIFIAENNVFSWGLMTFGTGDMLRVLDTSQNVSHLNGTSVADTVFTISEILSSNQLKISSPSFPLSSINKSFTIEQNAGTGDDALGNYIGSSNPSPTYDASRRWSYGPHGALSWSAAHEFVTLKQDNLFTAASAADDDADGRTDRLVLSTTLAGTTAAPGDHIVITNATTGRRVYEISNIQENTPSAGSTTVTVTYDEIEPSQTFSWQVLRRKNLLFSYPRVLIATK